VGSRPLVERLQQPVHLQIRQRKLIRQSSREQRPPVAHCGEPADNLNAGGTQRVDIQRRAPWCADQLR
jgi:hypothetical protein